MENMFCNKSDIHTEADVEAMLVEPLIRLLGYPHSRISRKDSIQRLTLARGSRSEHHRPDFVLHSNSGDPAIVIEAKAPGVSLENAIQQALGYAHAMNRTFGSSNPVTYCVATNADETVVCHWDNESPLVTLSFDQFTSGDAEFVQMRSMLGYVALQTLHATQEFFEFKRPPVQQVIDALDECHQIIWKKEGYSPPDAFFEFAKLLFVKLNEDKRINDTAQDRERLNHGDINFATHYIESEMRRGKSNPIADDLFPRVRNELASKVVQGISKPILDENETLDIGAETILQVVKLLENLDLHGIDEDLNGRMFETFLNATVRGRALGQFFTPRSVVKFMTKAAMLEVQNDGEIPFILDGCCGSGGFLIEAMAQMDESIDRMGHIPSLTREGLKTTLRKERLFGIDKSTNIAKIARLNMYLHGDGSSKIFNADALDKQLDPGQGAAHNKAQEAAELREAFNVRKLRFNVVLTNPPFSMSYSARNSDERKVLEDYQVRTDEKGASSTTLKSNVMFIERYHDLLEPGGELITVIDNTVLNGKSAQRFRDFIMRRFVVMAVISLPYNTFKQADAGVKTSILHLRKKLKDTDSQGDVFMAALNNVGHDDSQRLTQDRDNTEALTKAYLEWRRRGTHPNINEPPSEPSEIMECGFQAWVTSPSDISPQRLDAYYYARELTDLRSRIHATAELGQISVLPGRELSVVPPLPKRDVDASADEVFKYIEIGDITKSGLIDGYTSERLRDLPTRARMLVQEDDILVPKQVGCRGRATLIPPEFDGALVTTGFIVIRPANHEEALVLWSVLRSDLFSVQAYYLAIGSILTEFRPDALAQDALIPIPASKEHYDEVAEDANQLFQQQRRVAQAAYSLNTRTQGWLVDL